LSEVNVKHVAVGIVSDTGRSHYFTSSVAKFDTLSRRKCFRLRRV
jgi:hypothetical protein